MCKQQCIWLYNLGDEIGEEMAQDFLVARVRLLQGLSRHCRSSADVAKALWKQQQSAIKFNEKQGEGDSNLHRGELGSQILSLRMLFDDDEEGHEQMTLAGIEKRECERSDIVGRNRKTGMPDFSKEVESSADPVIGSSADAVMGSSAEAVVRLAQIRDANRRGTGGSGVGNAGRGAGGLERGAGGGGGGGGGGEGGGGVDTADEYGGASPFSDHFTDSGEEDDEVFNIHDARSQRVYTLASLS